MREIFFRGKKIDSGEWVEGCFSVISEKTVIIEKESENFYDVDGEKDCHGNKITEVITATICQYTGLTDKNGKKIWENDIVQYGAVAAIVKFGEYGNGNLGFYVDFTEETNYRKDFAYWTKKVIVVGNAFDNPELLLEVPE